MSFSAFTIIELIVVITVIALILAIAVPGMSAINLESRFSRATQTINGALTRAYFAALADVNMTAVRFLPGEWDFNETAEAQRAVGGQNMLTYSYVGTSAANPDNPDNVLFGEYFQRREGSSSIQLPDDIGIAPVEALDTGTRQVVVNQGNGDGMVSRANLGRDFVLSGYRRDFTLDAAIPSEDFLQADDFLIVFDPQTGVRSGVPTPMRVKAYVPSSYGGWAGGRETDRNQAGDVFYRRYSFSGIVLYRREPFVSLGDDPEARQNWLRANGRPYLVHRFSGGLVMGTQYSQ